MRVNVRWQSVAVMHSMEILSAVGALSAEEEPPATSSPPPATRLLHPLFRFQLGCIRYSSICSGEHRLGFNPAGGLLV